MHVKCVQKKYFSYIIDKIVLLRRNVSNILVIQAYYLLFLLILLFFKYFFIILLSFLLYISTLHSIGKFFKVSFFASLSYKYMKIWYFHGQYKANSLETNKISYNTKQQSSCTLSEERQNVHIFIQVAKQRKRKNIGKRGCSAIFRTLPNIYDEEFLQKYNG